MLTKMESRILYRFDNEQVMIEPWGLDALRVRATCAASFTDGEDHALLPAASVPVQISIDEKGASIINGHIRCDIDRFGVMTFLRDGKPILREYERNRYAPTDRPLCSALEIRPRMYAPHTGTGCSRFTVRFEANDGEKLYGMGQYQQKQLNLKGCTLELAHRNSQASVPFVVSNLGYGMLWNNPAIGRVTFASNVTEWEAESTIQMDYWICCGDTPARLEKLYSAATGRVPMMPDFALGFWQSKLRYQTQEELLNVAREYHRRGVPVGVMVADFFHWPHQGDWRFDAEYWPDVKAMCDELHAMGMKLMVSVWPTVQEDSENYCELLEKGYLVRSDRGSRLRHLGNACYLDVTNPDARRYLWDKLCQNYRSQGVDLFWLDEAEPEYTGYPYSNIRYSIGSDLEKGNLYPLCYARMAWDGFSDAGQDETVSLIRCAWAGSQRYGALVWSGDIESTFDCMRTQLVAGLNMGLAGIPWWTMDIGGFHFGDTRDPGFVELLIRWFQLGTFCPVMRLHGDREPHKAPLSDHGGGALPTGAENEIGSYGEEACAIMTRMIGLRERMRDYLRNAMRQAHEDGQPVMRTLFYNQPDDETAWEIDDEFFLGDDVLVCPVLERGAVSRRVYLPRGRWRGLWDHQIYEGGRWMQADAPIDVIPVYIRDGKLAEL